MLCVFNLSSLRSNACCLCLICLFVARHNMVQCGCSVFWLVDSLFVCKRACVCVCVCVCVFVCLYVLCSCVRFCLFVLFVLFVCLFCLLFSVFVRLFLFCVVAGLASLGFGAHQNNATNKHTISSWFAHNVCCHDDGLFCVCHYPVCDCVCVCVFMCAFACR